VHNLDIVRYNMTVGSFSKCLPDGIVCLVARFIECKNEMYSITSQSPLSQLNYTYAYIVG